MNSRLLQLGGGLREDGSALMTAAIAAAVLGIMVTSYLSWVTNEYRLTKHSEAWSQALYLAEAGMELGCAELNFPYEQGGSAFSAANGWTSAGANTYQKTVANFTDSTGTAIGSFSVLVANANSQNPTIQGVGTATVSQGPATSRGVQIWLTKGGSFPYAIAAKQNITMNGGAYVDSFNSSNPSESTGGQYDPTKRQANAVVASLSNSGTAVQATTIYGTVNTGPSGDMTLAGSIGPTLDLSLRATTVSQAQSDGWLTDDFTSAIPDVTLPANLSSAYNLGTVSSATTIWSGNWQANSITSSDSTKPIVIAGQVQLYVIGNFTTQGSGYVQISPGASLQVYVGGNVTVSGGGVVNQTGLAEDNQWYGLTSSTTWTVSGSGQWLGTVYAPEASVTFSGSSATIGAFVADNFTISGGSGVHYDQALSSAGGGAAGGYTVLTWQELQCVHGNWQP